MSVSDYILQLLALISALVAAHLLAGLHRLVIAGKRVRWDWLHLTAVAYFTAELVYGWWASWFAFAGEHVTALPFWSFLFPVFANSLLFFIVRTLVPEEVSPEGVDLAGYYRQHHRLLWTCQALIAVTTAGSTLARTLLLHLPLSPGFNPLAMMVTGLAAAGLACIGSRRVHAVVVPLLLLSFLAFALPVTLR